MSKYLFDFLSDIRKFSREKFILFLDYDGTLVPFVSDPSKAVPDGGMVELLEKLTAKKDLGVVIVTGRPVEYIRKNLEIGRVGVIGMHGMELEGMGERGMEKYREIVGEVEKKVGNLEKNGIIFENKEYSIVLHYRGAEKEEAITAKKQFLEICAPYKDAMEILEGSKVYELRPKGWDKGKGIERCMERKGIGKCIYVGDDVTDEDAFQFIRESGKGIGVVVGKKDTLAKYHIQNTEEVGKFMEWLCSITS